ncbi:MAG: glycosyltransferase family 4 protein [Nitrospira sp.]|nr:glycosyltransferase family 4 protein [Nitrospira sp.]
MPLLSAFSVMNLLLVVPAFPHPESPHTAPQNARTARVLERLVHRLVVIAPRPYVPTWLALRPHWKSYAAIPFFQQVGNTLVYRPANLVIPRVFPSFWSNEMASVMAWPLAQKLHKQISFDAILSFDLSEGGGVAWRLARVLGLPVAGWATGDDIRGEQTTFHGQKVKQALRNLDLVYYQTQELMEIGAGLLGSSSEMLCRSGRHQVLSRGISDFSAPVGSKSREAIRAELGILDNEMMVLYVGRVVFEKGLLGLIEAMGRQAKSTKRLRLVLLGSNPAFDHTARVRDLLRCYPELVGRVALLAACEPGLVWSYLNGADIFAFPSMKEGMPNALLEAMLAGVPCVTFNIPAVRDLVQHDPKALVAIPPFDYDEFCNALSALSQNPELRRTMGERGREVVKTHFNMTHNMQAVLQKLGRLTDLRKVVR